LSFVASLPGTAERRRQLLGCITVSRGHPRSDLIMENRDDKNQSTSQQSDLSKAQNQQQPQGQQNQQQPQGQSQQQQPQGQQNQQQPQGQSQQQQPQGQADYGSAGQSAGQSDSTTQQRTDIEGGTSTGQASDIEGSSQFVGSKSASDTSGEFIEDDDSSDFAKDGQGAAE